MNCLLNISFFGFLIYVTGHHDKGFRVEYFHDASRTLGALNWDLAGIVDEATDCFKQSMICDVAGVDKVPYLRITNLEGNTILAEFDDLSDLSVIEAELFRLKLVRPEDVADLDHLNIIHLESAKQFTRVSN